MTKFEAIKAITDEQKFSELVFNLIAKYDSPDALAKHLSESLSEGGLQTLRSIAGRGNYPLSLEQLLKDSAGGKWSSTHVYDAAGKYLLSVDMGGVHLHDPDLKMAVCQKTGETDGWDQEKNVYMSDGLQELISLNGGEQNNDGAAGKRRKRDGRPDRPEDSR